MTADTRPLLDEKLTLRLDAETKAAIRRKARAEDRSLNKTVLRILRQSLDASQ